MKPYKSYIICANPRSGSTLLCKLLAAAGVAGKPESYFHLPSISKWVTDCGISINNIRFEPDVMRDILGHVLNSGQAGTNVFGFRLMRKSFGYLMQQLDGVFPDLPNDAARFDAAFGRTLFIHLTRNDKVAQAVSVVKAMQTGLWHMAPDGRELERTAPPKQPVYDASLISQELAELIACDRDWARWFKQENIQPLILSYESLAENPTSALANILETLGLDQSIARNIRPEVGRLADQTSSDWIKRFQAEQGTH